MGETNSHRTARDQSACNHSSGIPAGLLAVLVVALLVLLGIGARYFLYGDLNVIHCLLRGLYVSVRLILDGNYSVLGH